MNHFLNSDVIWLESVDSTNEEIKRRIHEFTKPTWIIASKQSKGKGRNGNTWFSNYGNFSGSIIFFPTVEHTYFHLYGFFVGEVMKASSGKANPKLVNDILKKELKK